MLQKSDSNVVVKNNQIIFQEVLSFVYEIETNIVGGKEQRFFHLKITFNDDEGYINEYEKLLRSIRTASYSLTKQVITLKDDVSFYYANKAYPLIFNVENLMRRLISYFMLTLVGIKWKEETLPESTKTALKNSKRKESLNDVLHQLDFIELNDILFKSYQSKEKSNDELYKILKQTKNSDDLNLSELKEFIPKSNWQRYFSPIVKCEDSWLESKWKELYELRCKVAHNAEVTKDDFEKIKQSVDDIEKLLTEAFNKRNEVEVPLEEKEQAGNSVLREINQSVNRDLPNRLREIASIYNPLQNFQENLNRRLSPIQEAMKQLDYFKSIKNNIPTYPVSISGITAKQLMMERYINSPTINAIQEHQRNLDRFGLRGQKISRDINIEISPLYLFELEEGKKDVEVEAVLFESNSDDFEDDDFEDSEGSVNSESYELNNFPLTITIIHYPNTSSSDETLHKLRKPTDEEWYLWANEIERTRRYWSVKEIKIENAKNEDKDEDATIIYSPFYFEMTANANLYDKLILENAGFIIDEKDDFPENDFRTLPPELIKEIGFNVKDKVVTALYECYCWAEKSNRLNPDEGLVVQKITKKSKAYIIQHILRQPSIEESNSFCKQIIKGYFSTNEDNDEVIELKLDLKLAVELYDKLIIRIENANVSGQVFNEESKELFLKEVNPVYKFRVVEQFLNINAWNFEIDDFSL